jgi:hypothetical protein
MATVADLRAMRATIQAQPGISKYDLMDLFGKSHGNADVVLISLERDGFLTYEDEDNHIYPFLEATKQ